MLGRTQAKIGGGRAALLCAARQQLNNTIVGSLFEHGYLVQLDDHARTIAQRVIFKPARQTGRPVPRKCTCRCVSAWSAKLVRRRWERRGYGVQPAAGPIRLPDPAR